MQNKDEMTECKYCGMKIPYGYLCRQCQDMENETYYDHSEDDDYEEEYDEED